MDKEEKTNTKRQIHKYKDKDKVKYNVLGDGGNLLGDGGDLLVDGGDILGDGGDLHNHHHHNQYPCSPLPHLPAAMSGYFQ